MITPAITWPTPAAITYGTALSATQLNATPGDVAGTFVYTPAAGTVLNAGVGQTLVGDLHADRRGELHDGDGDGARSRSTKATPAITWATPASITYGTALSATQLNATASVPGTFVYTPASGTVLNAGVGADVVGDLHADRHGELHDGDGDRGDHCARRRRRRSRGRRRRITYGTALSATQLNATASVPGTFVYTPASGTVLNAGVGQTLSVTFTPTDAANYTTATATVAITVIEGDAGDHLGDAGGDHLRHGAERDAVERDGERAGDVRLHAGERDGARGRSGRRCRSPSRRPTRRTTTGRRRRVTITVVSRHRHGDPDARATARRSSVSRSS